MPPYDHTLTGLTNRVYPQYDIGDFTYGIPLIVDNENCVPRSTLKIGKFCSLSNPCYLILAGEHHMDWVTTYPFPMLASDLVTNKQHPTSRGDIVIGNDVWIGFNATIMSGVKIGDGAVIGSGAIVTRDVAPYSIVAGIPARHLRYRFSKPIREKLLKLKWWDWPEPMLAKYCNDLCSSPKEFFDKLKRNPPNPKTGERS